MLSERKNLFLTEIGKFILFLILTLVFYNLFTMVLTKFLITEPNVVKFRLICSLSQLISLGLLYAIYRPSIKELGFTWKQMTGKAKMLVIIGFSVLFLLIFLSYFIMSAKKVYALVTNFHFGLTTPVFEELIFRGYWWERLKKYNNKVIPTYILTSILFSLFHFGYYYIIFYTANLHSDAPAMLSIILTKVGTAAVLGFIFGAVRIKFKNVSAPIILHGILNILGD